MPSGLFITYRGYLDESGGGVQACTREYRAVIEAAGIDLTTIPFELDRRLSTRLLRHIDSSPYLRPVAPASLKDIIAQVRQSSAEFIFLNQVSLASIGKELRAYLRPGARLIVLSHGMESTDLLHLIRLQGRLPLSGRVRPTASVALGRVIRAESESRRLVDTVITLSPFDVELERWMGSALVGWLPRTITASALDWRPLANRLGWVGTLDHAPNLEGLVAALDGMARFTVDPPRVRIVGDPPHIGAWLSARYANVDYLGRLEDAILASEAATWSGFLHPIFCFPRGCSTKLATAIGWQIPIVTTPQGRRGYDWREGSLLEAGDPDAFARLALGLADPAFGAAVRAEVARVAETSPTLPEVAGLLRRFLDSKPAECRQP